MDCADWWWRNTCSLHINGLFNSWKKKERNLVVLFFLGSLFSEKDTISASDWVTLRANISSRRVSVSWKQQMLFYRRNCRISWARINRVINFNVVFQFNGHKYLKSKQGNIQGCQLGKNMYGCLVSTHCYLLLINCHSIPFLWQTFIIIIDMIYCWYSSLAPSMLRSYLQRIFLVQNMQHIRLLHGHCSKLCLLFFSFSLFRDALSCSLICGTSWWTHRMSRQSTCHA